MTETRSTCPYCGVGCGVIISTEGNQITDVRGDPDHPANPAVATAASSESW
jgi:assimilatory nitrate reductase catalytic subunit